MKKTSVILIILSLFTFSLFAQDVETDITDDLAANTPILSFASITSGNVYHYIITTASSSTGTASESVSHSVVLDDISQQRISGKKIFTTLLPETSVVPTTDVQLVNKKYVDDAISDAITDALGGSY